MKTNKLTQLIPLLLLLLVSSIFTGCEREMEDLQPAAFPDNGDVFINTFTGGLNYAAFGGSKPTAFEVVEDEAFAGTASMRFAVPDFEDPAGAYAGGSFFTETGRDLTGYNVLTFWARATRSASIDVIGFGNDLDQNRFQTAINGLEVNTNWQKFYIPVPDPAKLTEEKGLFFYSEGPEDGEGYTFWIDEVMFENLGTITPPDGYIFNGQDLSFTGEGGSQITPEAYVITNLPTGVDQRITTTPAFFEYTSSDPAVATVDENGIVILLEAGEAVITATLGGREATGSLTVTSTGLPVIPTTAAPVPPFPASEVISVYSNSYDNIPVDFYNGFWEFSTTQNSDFEVEGKTLIRYTDLNFVGIQFTNPTINVSALDRFRIDIWTPIPVDAGTEFKVLLFDLGSNNAFGGGDDRGHELTFTSPQLASETWVTIDVPLSDFTGLTTRSNLAQIVLSGDLPTVFVDNVLFHN